jgi:hypothetical protein
VTTLPRLNGSIFLIPAMFLVSGCDGSIHGTKRCGQSSPSRSKGSLQEASPLREDV